MSTAERFREIAEAAPFPLLVTVGADAHPSARPMDLLRFDGRSMWFATSRSSRKVAEIEAHPKVTVVFVDNIRFNYAYLHGQASIVTDRTEKVDLWQDRWSDDWPEGPSDDDYVLIKVVGTKGTYYHGGTDEAGETGFPD